MGRPFELRFSKEEAERLSHAATIDGDIITPWRVVMIGKDLNSLVNCDIIQSLSPPPDKELFPNGLNTSWIKPGRCVWKFLDGGDSDLRRNEGFLALGRRARVRIQLDRRILATMERRGSAVARRLFTRPERRNLVVER